MATRSRGPVVVVGGTSAIGRAIAREAARAGEAVVLAGRDEEELERSAADLRSRYGVSARAVEVDVEDDVSVDRFLGEAVRESAELRGLVLCQGFMAGQAEAADEWALAERMIRVNYGSVVRLCSALGPRVSRRGGFIGVVSSVAGDRGRMSNGIYGSTKAGVNAFLSGLRAELSKEGVGVTVVKPGFTDTAMTWGMGGMFLMASPERVGRDAWRGMVRGRWEVYTPWFWRWIMLVIRSIPRRVFDRLSI